MGDGSADAGARFINWLREQVLADARGDRQSEISTRPFDRFWLGRLASEASARAASADQRIQRLDPCAQGFRFRPRTNPPWRWKAVVALRVWTRVGEDDEQIWRKSDRIEIRVPIAIDWIEPSNVSFGGDAFSAGFAALGLPEFSARIDVEIGRESEGRPVTVVVVNQSKDARGADSHLYEVSLSLEVGAVTPFILDALPDSFRYDRRVSAYGIFGGVEYDGATLTTTDTLVSERRRPSYWDESTSHEPDLRFQRLASDPLPALQELVAALRRWGEREWSVRSLRERAESERWSLEMREEANTDAEKFWEEVTRCERGLQSLLRPDVQRAFRLTNDAFLHSGAGRYSAWRPFQIGFFLSCLPSIVDDHEPDRRIVDTLWFATGGGKTETYLAIVVFACLYDRIRGKRHGVTAWARFPLRMLSLQQTQRFAEAIAGAELARQREGIEGDPFALGFFVGQNGTPNSIQDEPRPNKTDANDPDMPARYRVLIRCPFCGNRELHMAFNRRNWRLEHRCGVSDCSWGEAALPLYLVDEEIYRFLPSVVIGTLDKAASVGMQAAMRGLYAAPIARCNGENHGFAYAPRSKTKGCLVPGCSSSLGPLPQDVAIFSPSIRLQDELHLLRGALGAMDAHYETLLDHLTKAEGGETTKIVASSATLSGYVEQAAALYARVGRAFPVPGPKQGTSFWTKDSDDLARVFVGLAPRGVTQEFANDRLAESLQRAVRRLLTEPEIVCQEAGIDPANASFLLSYYGTHVVYGNRIRDVEAAVRSLESQPGIEPLNVTKLTGATLLDEVRDALERLDRPEPVFEDRLHVVCASSMMSHGVDIDRFNVITLLGMPLTTAEFIQTTARIGRRYPGLVFALHRMAIERDASLFRSFDLYVRHAERFVEPIAITRKSKRVLRHTFPGLFLARVLGVHEPVRVRSGMKPLTMVTELRRCFHERPVLEEGEFAELCDALALQANAGDDPLVVELRALLRETFRSLNDPATNAKWPNEITPRPPMTSLRDVEAQVPIHVSIE